MAKTPSYNVTDGKLVLTLSHKEKGYYYVTSPMDPEIHTQARTIEEAFHMARDARKCLDVGRRMLRAEDRKAELAAARAAKKRAALSPAAGEVAGPKPRRRPASAGTAAAGLP